MDNEFSEEHRKTKKKAEHFPSLILKESLFELKLIDLPVIPFFPSDSLSEWTDYRYIMDTINSYNSYKVKSECR